MFRLAVLTLFIIGSNAGGYGGQLSGGLTGSSYSGGLSGALFGGQQTYSAPQSYGGLDANIQTHRSVELRPVASHGDYSQPQVIEVNPDHVPVQVHFRTASSRVNVQQSHSPGAPAQVEHASFQDEPHRVVHEVVKPVIQEVREIIQPYRRVTQEIRPVIEEVHTVVHKGEGRRQQGLPLNAGGGGGYSGGAGLAGNGYKSAKAAKGAKARA